MMQEEQGLFRPQLNEQGKKFIRKFAALSYTMLVLVIFENGVSIFWNIRMLVTRTPYPADYSEDTTTFYATTYPYVLLLISLLGLISNIYYLRFPRVLLHRIEINDELGINNAFGLLYKGAVIYLFALLLGTISLILSFTLQWW